MSPRILKNGPSQRHVSKRTSKAPTQKRHPLGRFPESRGMANPLFVSPEGGMQYPQAEFLEMAAALGVKVTIGEGDDKREIDLSEYTEKLPKDDIKVLKDAMIEEGQEWDFSNIFGYSILRAILDSPSLTLSQRKQYFEIAQACQFNMGILLRAFEGILQHSDQREWMSDIFNKTVENSRLYKLSDAPDDFLKMTEREMTQLREDVDLICEPKQYDHDTSGKADIDRLQRICVWAFRHIRTALNDEKSFYKVVNLFLEANNELYKSNSSTTLLYSFFFMVKSWPDLDQLKINQLLVHYPHVMQQIQEQADHYPQKVVHLSHNSLKHPTGGILREDTFSRLHISKATKASIQYDAVAGVSSGDLNISKAQAEEIVEYYLDRIFKSERRSGNMIALHLPIEAYHVDYLKKIFAQFPDLLRTSLLGLSTPPELLHFEYLFRIYMSPNFNDMSLERKRFMILNLCKATTQLAGRVNFPALTPMQLSEAGLLPQVKIDLEPELNGVTLLHDRLWSENPLAYFGKSMNGRINPFPAHLEYKPATHSRAREIFKAFTTLELELKAENINDLYFDSTRNSPEGLYSADQVPFHPESLGLRVIASESDENVLDYAPFVYFHLTDYVEQAGSHQIQHSPTISSPDVVNLTLSYNLSALRKYGLPQVMNARVRFVEIKGREVKVSYHVSKHFGGSEFNGLYAMDDRIIAHPNMLGSQNKLYESGQRTPQPGFMEKLGAYVLHDLLKRRVTSKQDKSIFNPLFSKRLRQNKNKTDYFALSYIEAYIDFLFQQSQTEFYADPKIVKAALLNDLIDEYLQDRFFFTTETRRSLRYRQLMEQRLDITPDQFNTELYKLMIEKAPDGYNYWGGPQEMAKVRFELLNSFKTTRDMGTIHTTGYRISPNGFGFREHTQHWQFAPNEDSQLDYLSLMVPATNPIIDPLVLPKESITECLIRHALDKKTKDQKDDQQERRTNTLLHGGSFLMAVAAVFSVNQIMGMNPLEGVISSSLAIEAMDIEAKPHSAALSSLESGEYSVTVPKDVEAPEFMVYHVSNDFSAAQKWDSDKQQNLSQLTATELQSAATMTVSQNSWIPNPLNPASLLSPTIGQSASSWDLGIMQTSYTIPHHNASVFNARVSIAMDHSQENPLEVSWELVDQYTRQHFQDEYNNPKDMITDLKDHIAENFVYMPHQNDPWHQHLVQTWDSNNPEQNDIYWKHILNPQRLEAIQEGQKKNRHPHQCNEVAFFATQILRYYGIPTAYGRGYRLEPTASTSDNTDFSEYKTRVAHNNVLVIGEEEGQKRTYMIKTAAPVQKGPVKAPSQDEIILDTMNDMMQSLMSFMLFMGAVSGVGAIRTLLSDRKKRKEFADEIKSQKEFMEDLKRPLAQDESEPVVEKSVPVTLKESGLTVPDTISTRDLYQILKFWRGDKPNERIFDIEGEQQIENDPLPHLDKRIALHYPRQVKLWRSQIMKSSLMSRRTPEELRERNTRKDQYFYQRTQALKDRLEENQTLTPKQKMVIASLIDQIEERDIDFMIVEDVYTVKQHDL